MSYITNDGELITHDNETQVLEYLRATAFTPCDSLQDFLDGMLARVKIHTGHEINPSGNHAYIVAELCAAGLLTRQ